MNKVCLENWVDFRIKCNQCFFFPKFSHVEVTDTCVRLPILLSYQNSTFLYQLVLLTNCGKLKFRFTLPTYLQREKGDVRATVY